MHMDMKKIFEQKYNVCLSVFGGGHVYGQGPKFEEGNFLYQTSGGASTSFGPLDKNFFHAVYNASGMSRMNE